ncbi:DNA alkylation repair protein [archaeon]|nr:DNA alkylation repair protein [archaeon]
MLENLTKELKKLYSKERAENSMKYFKTGKGEYGQGDIFLGLSMGEQREIAKRYGELSLSNLQKLLDSSVHEHRMIAGIILTYKFKENPEEVFNFYLKNAKRFNNWDLVDVTCPRIVGFFLINKNKSILYTLANSKNLWEKRISIISTFPFIKENQFADTLKISEVLLRDKHDLIHKAIGWMLREVGKKDVEVLKDFLKTNYKKLPRTTLRYAIERFPEKERKMFLKGKFN